MGRQLSDAFTDVAFIKIFIYATCHSIFGIPSYDLINSPAAEAKFDKKEMEQDNNSISELTDAFKDPTRLSVSY